MNEVLSGIIKIPDAVLQQREAGEDEAKIQELAALAPLKYDKVREGEAEKLCCRVSTLDAEVKAFRAKNAPASDSAEVDDLVEGVEPWPHAVSGDGIATEVRALLNVYCVLPAGADVAISLWIVAGYSINCFRIFPKLCLSSPEKRCGKTTTLETIDALAHRSLMASNLSPAVMFRAIEAWQPTLLIDEADTFLHGNDELRGVINSGHTRAGAFVLRVAGEELEPKKFSTWSPMAIAMIKTPPDTIKDRSVMIHLKRKASGDSVERLPFDLSEQCHSLRRKIKRWADDSSIALKKADPIMPSISSDRGEDNWRPLIAVADVLGSGWPSVAREAMKKLEQKEDSDEGVGVMLLWDIKALFAERKADRLPSDDIVKSLIDIDERPWAEWRYGQPLTKSALSRLLKPFGISPRTIRVAGRTPKGYQLASFQDSFTRYLGNTPIQTATTQQVSGAGAFSDIQSATSNSDVAVGNARKASNGGECCGVADGFPQAGQSGETRL